MVHRKAPHGAQLKMCVSSVGKVSGIYLWHWRGKNQIRESPLKCLYRWILIQSFSNILCPITHCALWLSGPLPLSLGIFLSFPFHPGRLQTGLKNKSQIIHISAVGGLTDTPIFLCWCANGRGPAEFGHQNYSPIGETVLQEFSFKAKSNPKVDFWRKPAEDLKPITLQCQVESSSLKEISNTEWPALWAETKNVPAKKPMEWPTIPTVMWWYFTCNEGCQQKFKPKKYFVHT